MKKDIICSCHPMNAGIMAEETEELNVYGLFNSLKTE